MSNGRFDHWWDILDEKFTHCDTWEPDPARTFKQFVNALVVYWQPIATTLPPAPWPEGTENLALRNRRQQLAGLVKRFAYDWAEVIADT